METRPQFKLTVPIVVGTFVSVLAVGLLRGTDPLAVWATACVNASLAVIAGIFADAFVSAKSAAAISDRARRPMLHRVRVRETYR